MKKVAIYGIGNFGYAILKHLDKKKSSDFKLYAHDHDAELINFLDKNREHPYFHPGKKVSKKIIFVEARFAPIGAVKSTTTFSALLSPLFFMVKLAS